MFSFLSLGYTITDMDKEQIVFLAGVTLCALSIGAFIFWGPNPKPRRRGALIGLQNLGLTCFLNTLLQAMASCPIFIEWLESCHDQGRVASTLYYLLKVLSSERSKLPPSVEDPLAPSALIVALQRHGWAMGSGEQDAHELFHLLMVSLEEEAHKAIAAEKGLSDALEPRTVHRRRSLPSCSTGDLGDGPVKANCVESNHVVNQPSGDAHSLPPLSKLVNKHGELITRQVVPKYDCNQNYQTSPFCGLLTSQLQCVTCGFKSVLRFDKFDSLSLHLPDKRQSRHTLSQLLDDFTHTEAVTGVACEGCNKGLDSSLPPVTATSLKTLTIGKLPRCLCIHIHRMSMAFGTPYKRSDDIDFPEFLIMDPYTHNAMIKEQKLKEASKSTREDPQESQTLPSFLPCRTEGWNHIYRLKAVVVHCGSVESGHFVTYRRGPLQSNTRHRSDRWYFTSDETVRDTTLAEAMQAAAYMLFYEKCANTKPSST